MTNYSMTNRARFWIISAIILTIVCALTLTGYLSQERYPWFKYVLILCGAFSILAFAMAILINWRTTFYPLEIFNLFKNVKLWTAILMFFSWVMVGYTSIESDHYGDVFKMCLFMMFFAFANLALNKRQKGQSTKKP